MALKTRASLEGGEWVVRGQKLYTSLADDADAILVLCRTDAVEDKRSRGLSLVLTPRNQPAVQVRRLELMGMRAACTCEVFLDGARAPADALIGERGGGWRALLRTLDEERILCAAMYVGITAAALEQALQYARDRHAFGRPIGAFQAVQHPLADIATELEQIRLITAKAAWLQSLGRDCAVEAAMAKLAASETAVRATDRSYARAGWLRHGRGVAARTPVPRHAAWSLQPDLERNGAQLRRRAHGPSAQLLMKITKHFVTVGKRRVHYLRAGSGPALAMLHASPCSAKVMRPLLPVFGERFTCLAFDTPGFGLSDKLPMPKPRIEEFADALAETLNALGVEHVATYGRHTGASIAVEFAARHPQSLRHGVRRRLRSVRQTLH